MTDDPDDFETFLMAWARKREADAVQLELYRDRCQRCGHRFHGLTCMTTSERCTCPGLEETA
jgi:hypothetical protein